MRFSRPILPAVTFLLALVSAETPPTQSHVNKNSRVFEIRRYTTNVDKLEALKTRFREHTIRLFEKHGITSIAYWIPADTPRSKNTFVYVLSHPNRDLAKQHWAEFLADPEWIKVKAESEVDGELVAEIDSEFVNPTDFSPLQ